jgi:mono/diheme cytochrome c family protein
MPPVPGLDDDEIDAITAYVRSQQEAEGFEPYPPS